MMELNYLLSKIRQGHCPKCNAQIWNCFDVECDFCKFETKLIFAFDYMMVRGYLTKKGLDQYNHILKLRNIRKKVNERKK